MSDELSIDENYTLAQLQDELNFLEEGKYLVKGVVAEKNTVTGAEFNDVTVVIRTVVLQQPLLLITADTPDDLDSAADDKVDAGYDVIFLSDQVLVEGRRVPVGALRHTATTDKLSWEAGHPDRSAWSQQLLKSLQSVPDLLTKGNGESFVAGYNALNVHNRLLFWAELLIGVSSCESSWNPNDVYPDVPEASIGLLQLSKGDQDNYGLTPKITDENDLMHPLLNLQWGVVIFAKLVLKDGVVAVGSSLADAKGAAKYWSTLWENHVSGGVETLPWIKQWVKDHVPM